MQGIGFAQREEFGEERHGTFVPRANGFLVLIKPLFRFPQEGEGKQEEPDGVSRNISYGYGIVRALEKSGDGHWRTRSTCHRMG